MASHLSTSSLLRGHALRLFIFIGFFIASKPWLVQAGSLAKAESPQVTVNGATFVGTSQSLAGLAVGIDFFGGIPFAEPPLDHLRFAPPVLKDVLHRGLMDATQFGAPCAQLNGTPLIYVSINYRVGPFGFPQGAEADQRGALNLGLKDQLAGLTWVKKHIRAFRGDPEKVTVFGQSAGAMSIADLYLNSGLEKLVRGAILESGSAASLPWFNASRREVVWDTLTANVFACVNASRGQTFPCLRTANTSTLLDAWQTTVASLPELPVFVPVIDGPRGLIPDIPTKLFAQGKFSRIPFIAGTNLDEGTDFVPPAISTEEQLVEFLTVAAEPFLPGTEPPPEFQKAIARMLELYPDDPALGSPFGTGNETFGLSSQFKRAAALTGDSTFQAPRRAWMQAASDAGVGAFGYYFTDQNAVLEPELGVHHAIEVPYVYGEPAFTSNNSAVRILSSSMVDYWISFAVSLTPNDGKGLPKTVWPQYKPNSQVLLQFDTLQIHANSTSAEFSVIPDTYRAEQISFITSVDDDINL